MKKENYDEETQQGTDNSQEQVVQQPQQGTEQPKTVATFKATDLEHSGTKQSQEVQQAVSEENKPVTTYTDFINKMKKQEAEDEAVERKRQRRNAVIAAIGDGLTAFSNLYFTTKGAPSMYDPQQSMSAKLRQRYDKLNAERRARDREWRSAYLRAEAMDRQAENDRNRWKLYRRKLDAQQEQWQRAQEAKEAAQKAKDEAKERDQKIAERRVAVQEQIANDRRNGVGGYARGRGGGGRGSSTRTTETYDSKGNLKKTVVQTPQARRPQQQQSRAGRGSLLPGKQTKGSLLPKK